MTKLKWLRILNILVILGFLTVAISIGLALYSPFPSLRGSGVLGEIHETAGKIFFILVIFHIILNWNWIKAQYFKVTGKTDTKKKAK
ncbi:MAG TPA: DUF4405 domain-containing protein [Candidatus Cloacimonadota bacterium]|nr:DUF4405 domain-containing protein [Candidatus Cloacimonadota bacterium]HPT72072.1 DUF4405 domain-containing protein [Candidatus Cloacimonadota bacterium]